MHGYSQGPEHESQEQLLISCLFLGCVHAKYHPTTI